MIVSRSILSHTWTSRESCASFKRLSAVLEYLRETVSITNLNPGSRCVTTCAVLRARRDLFFQIFSTFLYFFLLSKYSKFLRVGNFTQDEWKVAVSSLDTTMKRYCHSCVVRVNVSLNFRVNSDSIWYDECSSRLEWTCSSDNGVHQAHSSVSSKNVHSAWEGNHSNSNDSAVNLLFEMKFYRKRFWE